MSGRGHILVAASLGDHVDRLYRAAWALCGSRADAEDLVQETLARVLAQPRRVQGESDLAYLLQALRNTFLSSRRTASRRIVAVDPPPGFEPVDRSAARRPDEALEVREVASAGTAPAAITPAPATARAMRRVRLRRPGMREPPNRK